jgi:hypothetical protein
MKARLVSSVRDQPFLKLLQIRQKLRLDLLRSSLLRRAVPPVYLPRQRLRGRIPSRIPA